jgi:hypothetical protein
LRIFATKRNPNRSRIGRFREYQGIALRLIQFLAIMPTAHAIVLRKLGRSFGYALASFLLIAANLGIFFVWICPSAERARDSSRFTGRLVSREPGIAAPQGIALISVAPTGSSQAVWALRIMARDRYSDGCWNWGERLGISLDRAADRPGRRWNGVMTADAVREGQNDTVV